MMCGRGTGARVRLRGERAAGGVKSRGEHGPIRLLWVNRAAASMNLRGGGLPMTARWRGGLSGGRRHGTNHEAALQMRGERDVQLCRGLARVPKEVRILTTTGSSPVAAPGSRRATEGKL
jgi:hypothetical protein